VQDRLSRPGARGGRGAAARACVHPELPRHLHAPRHAGDQGADAGDHGPRLRRRDRRAGRGRQRLGSRGAGRGRPRRPRRAGRGGGVRPGGLAGRCAVAAHHLVRLPPEVSFEEAACLPVAYGTAIRMMYTIGQIQPQDRILVLGASGGVGTAAVLLSKLAGAEVIACASSPAKLERLKQMGADHVIDYTKEDFVKWVYAKYGKPHRRRFEGGVDVVVNFTGGDTWVPSLRAVHRRGKVLTCGATAGFDPKEDLRYVWSFEIQVLGSNSFMPEDLAALLDLIRQGKLKPIVDKALPLSEVNEAFRLIEQREVFGKVVLKP